MNELLSGYDLSQAGSCPVIIQLDNTNSVTVRPKRNQINLWISLTEPDATPTSLLRPVPAVFDTGFGGSLLISELWLRRGIGLDPNRELCMGSTQPFTTASGSVSGVGWCLDVWAHPQTNSPVPLAQFRPPVCLGNDGEVVHIISAGTTGPPLPLIGMGMFRNRDLNLAVRNGLVDLAIS